MPKKLQIKLLSQSGELLSMTNCSVGQISVLRAESPSELKPYQRALGGNQGRERFVITVDGRDYNTEEHHLIGFGEVAPHAGLTVGQYLAAAGLIEGAISGLLMAYGIEGIESKLCSALSPDEDRKIRLFAATADPSKALILNEPFEPISSSWRERIAEFLTDFARNKNGLIVVASLSYRPDSWIDNAAIARHQVGQTLRRTIGFGGAGSESAQLMSQLREQILNEEKPTEGEAPPTNAPRFDNRPTTAAASLGAAAMIGGVNTEEALEPPEAEDYDETYQSASPSALFTTLKAVTALGAGGLGVWAAVTLLRIQPPKDAPAPPQQAVVTQQEAPTGEQSQPAPVQQDVIVQPPAPQQFAKEVAPPAPKVAYLLDRYPEAIRVSILDTSRGIMGDPSQASVIPPPPEAQKPNNQDGSFYKLLESAGSDKADAGAPDDSGWQQPSDSGAWSAPESSEPVEYNPAEEEERREAIRQKFLEAIRAAAERREEEGMAQ